MNTTEQLIFNQHMNNIDSRFEDFWRECTDLQTPEALSILWATDVHYIRKYALYVASYYKVKEMVDFSGVIGADLVAITGDIVDGNTTMKRQYRDIYDIMGLLKQSKSTSVLLSKGNHDTCEWYAYQNKLGEGNWLTAKDWYIHAVNPLRVQFPMVLDEQNVCGGYYYIDFPLRKIRVININTSDTQAVTDENGILLKEYCSQWRMGLREKQHLPEDIENRLFLRCRLWAYRVLPKAFALFTTIFIIFKFFDLKRRNFDNFRPVGG